MQLPAKGTPPPARDASGLATLLRTAGATDTVLAATGGWLLSERRSSPATQDGYIRDVSWWLWWIQARGMDLTDVSFIEADTYAAAMRHAGLAPGTRRRRLSACSSWYAYLQRADAAVRNPFHRMDLPKRASKPSRYLTEAQLDDLVMHAVAHQSARTAAIVAVLKATACRISELTGVQLAALGHAGDHWILTLTAKGGRPHRVVIDDDVTGPLLDAYLAERGSAPGPLFATRTGARLQRSYVQELLQRLASSAGIPDPHTLTPHAIRHSVATALLRAGEPLDVVQALLGHADPRTTQAYLHVDQLERSPAHRAGRRLAAVVARRLHSRTGTREPRPADIAQAT
ncbi:tyrosine recombinase [Nonomuraea africana]|uniref:Site-specific recombinase XerD n=1 Tax=Nonomuraea africana TaxID=46171 RepID=A0ABR9KEC2_9ACTN|nr:tyrosine-type recombinase/integrase [Nonomuraea africana]MBE1560126.1 site-specific recombinase XerD [Nonomuraea africana]